MNNLQETNDPSALRNLAQLMMDKADLLQELNEIKVQEQLIESITEAAQKDTACRKTPGIPVKVDVFDALPGIRDEDACLHQWQKDLVKEIRTGKNSESEDDDFWGNLSLKKSKNSPGYVKPTNDDKFLLSIQQYGLPEKNKYLIPESSPISGFKGFELSKNSQTIKCRSTDFGSVKGNNAQIFSVTPPVKLCGNGFHFCNQLADVDAFYSFNDTNHVFYHVTAWGEINVDRSKKIAAQFLKIGKPLSKKEMGEEQLKPIMERVDKCIELNNNLVISGSLALILLGLMPFRPIGDLDFTLPYFQAIGDEENFLNEFGNSGEECYQFHVDGEKLDIFLNPTISFTMIEVFGKKYKISNPTPIINAKWRYFLAGKEKHGIDIMHFIQNKHNVDTNAMKNFIETHYGRGKDEMIKTIDLYDDETAF